MSDPTSTTGNVSLPPDSDSSASRLLTERDAAGSEDLVRRALGGDSPMDDLTYEQIDAQAAFDRVLAERENLRADAARWEKYHREDMADMVKKCDAAEAALVARDAELAGLREQLGVARGDDSAGRTPDSRPPDSFWREVPCGHPQDPEAWHAPDGHYVCHCGWGLDPEDGQEVQGAPGPVVWCGQCGCAVALGINYIADAASATAPLALPSRDLAAELADAKRELDVQRAAAVSFDKGYRLAYEVIFAQKDAAEADATRLRADANLYKGQLLASRERATRLREALEIARGFIALTLEEDNKWRDQAAEVLDRVALSGGGVANKEDETLEADRAETARVRADAASVAHLFHETYERLAPDYGYETRPESAVPWDDVPIENRGLMVAVAAEVLRELGAERSGEASSKRGDS